MKREKIEIICDTGGPPLLPRVLDNYVNQIENMYISAVIGMNDDSLKCGLNSNNYGRTFLGKDDSFFNDCFRSLKCFMAAYESTQISTSSLVFEKSLFWPKQKYDISKNTYEKVANFNYVMTREQLPYPDYSWERKRDFRKLDIIDISYENPLKITYKGMLAAIVVSVIITGGEINLREGSAKINGLTDATERIANLINEYQSKESEGERDQVLIEYLQKLYSGER